MDVKELQSLKHSMSKIEYIDALQKLCRDVTDKTDALDFDDTTYFGICNEVNETMLSQIDSDIRDIEQINKDLKELNHSGKEEELLDYLKKNTEIYSTNLGLEFHLGKGIVSTDGGCVIITRNYIRIVYQNQKVARKFRSYLRKLTKKAFINSKIFTEKIRS